MHPILVECEIPHIEGALVMIDDQNDNSILDINSVLSPTRYLASPDTWPSQNVTESNVLSHPRILKSAQCTRIEVKFMFYLA